MMFATIVWAAPNWIVPAVLLGVCGVGLAVWSYWNANASGPVRAVAALLKIAGISALAICLIEPLYSGVRPRPGANLLVMLADNSRGLQIKDAGLHQTRGEIAKTELASESDWQTRLSQDFDVRRYTFETRLEPVFDFSKLAFDGNGSAMMTALKTVSGRYHGRPNAGILWFTEGNATDVQADAIDWKLLPPIYPVVLGRDKPAKDVRVARVSVTQTNFELSPVTILAEIETVGYKGRSIVVELQDESGKEVQKQVMKRQDEDQPLVHRFQLLPEKKGISFYRVRAYDQRESHTFDRPEASSEATLVNNDRLVMVDRGTGPYRGLYVSGRPNWEFKFLRRAIEDDQEVDLVGLLRIAKKEPKFTFRSHKNETTNSIFRGFGNEDDEDAEQYDQPVLIRLGTRDAEELRDGFPQAADELFQYDAIVLDDLDAGFFTQDQMSLIQEFVSHRGGGFLMLGGRESFTGGKYDRTPIGELLPIYLDRVSDEPLERYRLDLTREGLLQPWVRLRSTEQDEEERIREMPAFKTVNRVNTLKPGATVLANLQSDDGHDYPGLVVQRFGKGRAGAILIGDMWRWSLRRRDSQNDDLQQSWRQTMRWLVSDVPGRIDVDAQHQDDNPSNPIELHVTVHDESYDPLDNASVTVTVTTPDDKTVELTAAPSQNKAGIYVALYQPRLAGGYRAQVLALAPDGSEIGQRETGWVADPETKEFESLIPNRTLLQEIAEKTEGEVIELSDIHGFVSSLPSRKIPVTEPWIYPLWHQWGVFCLAAACLIGEWGLRRWKGLA
ncbi:MAG: glutamine amidotransferase [Pirellulaceae bacterium]|nr:glutamine amidotransferase [Pirellulaceae bacterium]